jgi:hypothetical protein
MSGSDEGDHGWGVKYVRMSLRYVLDQSKNTSIVDIEIDIIKYPVAYNN